MRTSPAQDIVARQQQARLRRWQRSGRLALLGLVGLAVAATGCTEDDARTAGGQPDLPATATTTTTTTSRPAGPIDELVLVHGARMHVRCAGAGDRTVVLIGGFEDDGASWAAVEPALTDGARVCSYARPGTGTSDPALGAHTFATHARDLRALLEAIGEPGPHIVVGHSFGGSIAVTYASMYPELVGGVVLVDATPVTWREVSCAVPDDGSEAARSFQVACAMMSSPEGNTERLDAVAAFDEVAEVASLGDVPMAVLTATSRRYPGLEPGEASRLGEIWMDGQARWSALSTAAQLVAVEGSGHYIQLERPDVVVEQVRQVLSQASDEAQD